MSANQPSVPTLDYQEGQHTRNLSGPNKNLLLKTAYLLLSFPLGILYFVFLVTGLTLSAGLMITFIGFPLLIIVLMATKAFIRLEKRMARAFTGNSGHEPETAYDQPKLSIFRQAWNLLKDPQTYSDVFCLLLRFPLGILNFVVVVTFVSVTVAMIASPLVFVVLNRTIDVDIFENSLFYLLGIKGSSWMEAWVYTGVGLLFIPLTVKVINGLTAITARSLALFSK